MRMHTTAVLTAAALVLAGCGGERGGTDGELSGSIEIDGSSTVYPISQAVAEEFMIESGGDVRVTVGVSGTGGGFRRFCAGETEISNASRAIKDDERALCEQAGVDPLELQVAIDGLAVTVHPENTMVQCLTVEELRRIWEPGSTLKQWSEVREGLPAQPLRLYGPGTNSGTFDYFTEAIVGEEDASRPDYSASEDDNVLVQGVGGDVNALGYFGYAYYIENQDKLRAIGVDNGNGCVEPTPETVTSGQYAPLSRPLFIYVNRSDLQRPEVAEFVRFYMETAAELVTEVGYVPMDAASYQANLSQLQPSGTE
ncbi:MAG TPA: PstS family phosphate ABC transporter substrate-binding protein [Longimicrobiales bacterium]|nr:PstS family phosphate ABC transporter substrate-binding protein [Longimicrobiales bacterium]